MEVHPAGVAEVLFWLLLAECARTLFIMLLRNGQWVME
jgi:hypothetical protein